jgi:hypothetical protein
VLEALALFEASMSQDNQDQAKKKPGANADASLSPEEQARAWLDETNGLADADQQAPTGKAMSADEFRQALESAAPLESDAEAAQTTSPKKAVPTGQQRRANRSRQSNGLIPWYVALLIIAVVLVLVAALVYFALAPDSLPIDLSLQLPQFFPLLN